MEAAPVFRLRFAAVTGSLVSLPRIGLEPPLIFFSGDGSDFLAGDLSLRFLPPAKFPSGAWGLFLDGDRSHLWTLLVASSSSLNSVTVVVVTVAVVVVVAAEKLSLTLHVSES